MAQKDKTKEGFIEEINSLKKKIAQLESADSHRKQQQSDDCLQKSEAELRAILDATPFPVALVDIEDNKINYWSHSATTIFGHTAPTASGWYKLAYPDPDYRNQVIAHWKPALENAKLTGEPVNTGEYQVTCRDGSVRICELYAAFLKDKLIVTFNDITERKQAEKALKESEEKFRTIFNNSTDGIVITDLKNKKFIDANNSMCRMLGYSLEEIKTLGVTDIHPKESLSYILDQIEKQSKDILEPAADLPVKRKDGTIFYANVLGTKMSLLGKDYMVGVFRDVTKRRESEEQIISLSRFPEENPYPVLRIARDGTILYSNNAAKLLFVELNLDIGKQAPKRWDIFISKAFESKRQQGMEEEIGAKVFSFAIAPIKGNEYVNLYGCDITERKKMEEELRKSEAQMSNAMKIANLGHWELDVVSGMFTFNDNFYNIFHTTAKEMGGYQMSIDDYSKRFVHPQDAALVAEETRKAVESDDPNFSQQLEHRIIYADGSQGYIVVRYFIVKNDAGKTIRTYGVNQDITEYKKLEENTKKHMRELEVFYKSSMGREERIIELKKEIEGLKKKLNGQPG